MLEPTAEAFVLAGTMIDEEPARMQSILGHLIGFAAHLELVEEWTLEDNRVVAEFVHGTLRDDLMQHDLDYLYELAESVEWPVD